MANRGVRLDRSARVHVDTAVEDWLENVIGPAILGDAQRTVPKRTGRLASSLRAEVSRKVLRVGSLDCNYCTDVELGTGPHVILPHTKRALSWPGADHPVARVNHPGTAPHPFLRPALFQRRTP